jgi:hypothetical protein
VRVRIRKTWQEKGEAVQVVGRSGLVCLEEAAYAAASVASAWLRWPAR